MEPGTGLAVLGTAIGSAKLLEKILGPTAEYLGEGLQTWAEKRVTNVGRILKIAAEKLGDEIETPRAVPPKILKGILDDGSYCDDELVAEYFGGVLASARTGLSRDDRASVFLKLTAELSSYQVRFHFICYLAWRQLFVGSGLRPTFSDDLKEMWIHCPASWLGPAMDFSEDEPTSEILEHCTIGLARHEILEVGPWGSADFINSWGERRKWTKVTETGLSVAPTQFGIDFWLWGIGIGQTSRQCFLDPELGLPRLPDVTLTQLPQKLLDEQPT